LASFYGAPYAIYRNTDAGGLGTWNPVLVDDGIARTSLAIAPSNQHIVYALAARGSEGGLLAVYRSTDGGTTWVPRVRYTDSIRLNTLLLSDPYSGACGVPNRNQGNYDNVIAVDPLDPQRVWAGGIFLFRSDDGGANWGLCDNGIHLDQHVILFHPRYDGSTN